MLKGIGKMSDLPLITIGVSAYNRKDYLKECLDSLLAQSYSNCQIIVVDDGSSDGTGEMMKELYPDIQYVYQENAGDSAAKNHAARLGKGEYIVFNDSDDVFLPDAVERLFKALPDGEKNAVSYGSYITIDAKGNQLPTKRKIAAYPSGNITGALLEHILVNCTATLMPRELFLQHNGLGDERRVGADYALFLELSCSCNFYAVQEPVFLRRRHGNNLSSASYGKMLTVYRVLEDFLQKHPEAAGKYQHIVRKRRGDLNNKLYREARREKLTEEAFMHAAAAFKNAPSVKSFFRLLAAALQR